MNAAGAGGGQAAAGQDRAGRALMGSGPRPRVLFFGLPCPFSALALRALLDDGLPVAAVVTPGPRRPGAPPVSLQPPAGRPLLPMLEPAGLPSLEALAATSRLPLLRVARLDHPATLATLAGLRADLICVACYPARLPPALLASVPLGGLNLHPSLLPAWRGPAPRFWAFRRGLTATGVTVHIMTDVLDAGPSVARAPFALPTGMTGAEFDARAATVGGPLLAAAARHLAAGTITILPRDERLATAAPWPTPADLIVPVDQPARWVYSFVRGVGDEHGPLALVGAGRPLAVAGALAYRPDADQGQPIEWSGATAWVRCRPGRVRVRLTEASARPPPE